MSVKGIVDIYTDGSYTSNVPDQVTGGGCVLIDGQLVSIVSFLSKDETIVQQHQIGGEIFSVLYLLQFLESCIDDKVNGTNVPWTVTIYHDYNGVGFWATGEWRAKTVATSCYKSECNYIIQKLRKLNVTVKFQHVAGHTGVKWNEIVDKVAKGQVNSLPKEYRDMYDGKVIFRLEGGKVVFEEEKE